MANLKYFIWLTTRQGLQPGDPWALLRRFGTPEALYYADPQEYELLDLPAVVRESLEDKDLTGVDAILADCERLGVRILTIQDADYPSLLSHIDDPPCVLYWKGKALALDDKLTLAVVGTRSCTPYGVDLAGRLGLDLARSGAVLVSGIAEGIDSAGIRGALQGGGSVVSVLGGGVDVVYPRQNQWLYEDVCAAGALVSEYPPGTRHAGFHFPVRNRVLSGLAWGTVVVEAGVPSGALITARLALDQGREVFAFPGPVGAPASLGANRLIQRGEAKLVLSAADVLVEFGTMFPLEDSDPLDDDAAEERLEAGRETPAARPRVRRSRRRGGETSSAPETEKEVDKPTQRAYISLSETPEALTDDERDVLLAIQKEDLTADDIAETTRIPARRVLTALTMLQLRGWAEERPGKRFQAAVDVRP